MPITLIVIIIAIILVVFILKKNNLEKFGDVFEVLYTGSKLNRIIEITVPESKNTSELNKFTTTVMNNLLTELNKKYDTKYSLDQVGVVSLLPDKTFKFNCNVIDQTDYVLISVMIILAADATRIVSIESLPSVDTVLPGYTPSCPAVFNETPTDSIILTPELQQIYENDIKKINEVKYLCFGTSIMGISNEKDCEINKGDWDSPVVSDTECPYYLANKNYTNNRGMSNNGYCELPSGLLNLGYRNVVVDPDNSVALCYNCETELIGQGSLGRCCEIQKFDPRFNGPDYKFQGDSLQRESAISELTQRDLKIN